MGVGSFSPVDHRAGERRSLGRGGEIGAEVVGEWPEVGVERPVIEWVPCFEGEWIENVVGSTAEEAWNQRHCDVNSNGEILIPLLVFQWMKMNGGNRFL